MVAEGRMKVLQITGKKFKIFICFQLLCRGGVKATRIREIIEGFSDDPDSLDR
jgi:hypothetical protein